MLKRISSRQRSSLGQTTNIMPEQTLLNDPFDELEKCSVGIEVDGFTKGTGIIVSESGLTGTCYHVIGDIRTKTIIHRNVGLQFPLAPDFKEYTNVIEHHCDPELDVSFLQLQGELPKQVAIAYLSETIDPMHAFRSFGFRRGKIFDGLYCDGIIQGIVRKKSS
jgi:hypothetical protein